MIRMMRRMGLTSSVTAATRRAECNHNTPPPFAAALLILPIRICPQAQILSIAQIARQLPEASPKRRDNEHVRPLVRVLRCAGGEQEVEKNRYVDCYGPEREHQSRT